ncbi:MAG: VanW family protein [Clostridia bacterium]|nr:factor for cell wall maintenance or synthesis YoaR [Oscillospiraceae bacterium]MBQ7033262.1 VanW family protein [Clostridia bacterium]
MKFLMVLLAVFMLGGCNMEGKAPITSELPSILPSEMPSILPSALPTAEPTIKPTAAATESPVALGTYITRILDTDPNRVNNLQICASVLEGVTVGPGEEFSFNTTVGMRTGEKGYEEAKILVCGEREYAVGGGICQISSTLYNAAEDAGMEITERHNHTGEVHYVEIGRDAAVSFGEQDFRFRNPLDVPVRISITVENTEVKAVLYKIVTQA